MFCTSTPQLLSIGFLSLFLLLNLSSLFLMADSEHSSSDHVFLDSKEETSQVSQLDFSVDEEALVIRMYNIVGERWSLIAGRIPGRTAEEVEKYWNSRHATSD